MIQTNTSFCLQWWYFKNSIGFQFHLHSFGMGAGGLRVAQFVLIGRLPSHCPFMLLMAVSASWTKNNTRNSVNNIDLLQTIFLRRFLQSQFTNELNWVHFYWMTYNLCQETVTTAEVALQIDSWSYYNKYIGVWAKW